MNQALVLLLVNITDVMGQTVKCGAKIQHGRLCARRPKDVEMADFQADRPQNLTTVGSCGKFVV